MANYKVTERTKKDKDGNVKGKEKCIIVDFVNLTQNEREAVEMYVKMGYTIYPKKAKAKTGKGLTKEKMLEELKTRGNAEAVAELEEKIKNKENFMKITSWYKETIGEKKKK